VAIDEADLLAAHRRLEVSLHNVLYRWLWDSQECQDLSQEAFMRVWKDRQRVDPQRIDALIYATALNLARNRMRWRGLWRFQSPDENAACDGDGPEAFALRSCSQQRVRSALQKLDASARNLLLLSEFAGLSTMELAEVLKVPEGTIASRKHRAMAVLKGILEGDDVRA
jgi:RNA polymerase sigma factor (sigma-70 family)